MIVDGLSFCIPTPRFRPADSTSPPRIRSLIPLFCHFLSLFCTRAKPISFLFNPLRTLVTKHPGVTWSVLRFPALRRSFALFCKRAQRIPSCFRGLRALCVFTGGVSSPAQFPFRDCSHSQRTWSRSTPLFAPEPSDRDFKSPSGSYFFTSLLLYLITSLQLAIPRSTHTASTCEYAG
jgi:hypothetical protein